jgi:signal peptide peptidase SppA
MKRYRFDRPGPLAIDAAAWGIEYDAAPAPPVEQHGSIAVVTIRGPLTHHSDGPCDSYDAIKARCADAFASPAAYVAVKVDSPGGDAEGCLDTSRELRAMASAAGKPLYVYVAGKATSAAYALATAADAIFLAAESRVGSIGVIAITVDATEADRQMGLKFECITSGKRKADGNPHVVLSDEARAALQGTVDDLAELFFALVSERRGLNVERVRGLEASMFHGAKAVAAGLADGVASFSELLALIASGGIGGGAAKEAVVDYKELVAALRSLAEGDDEEQAKKAKAALVAMGEEEPDGDEEKKDEKAEGEPEEKAEAEGDDKKEDEKTKASARSSVKTSASTSAAVSVAVELETLRADVSRLAVSAMLDKRPDLAASTRAWLETQSAEVVKSFLKTAARATAPRNAKPATGALGATSRLAPEAKRELDARMGLGRPQAAVRREGNAVVFGVMDRDTARSAASAGKESIR